MVLGKLAILLLNFERVQIFKIDIEDEKLTGLWPKHVSPLILFDNC